MMDKSEMLVPRESEAEAAGVLNVLAGMNEEQKRELLVFLDGVAFGRRLSESAGEGPAA